MYWPYRKFFHLYINTVFFCNILATTICSSLPVTKRLVLHLALGSLVFQILRAVFWGAVVVVTWICHRFYPGHYQHPRCRQRQSRRYHRHYCRRQHHSHCYHRHYCRHHHHHRRYCHELLPHQLQYRRVLLLHHHLPHPTAFFCFVPRSFHFLPFCLLLQSVSCEPLEQLQYGCLQKHLSQLGPNALSLHTLHTQLYIFPCCL